MFRYNKKASPIFLSLVTGLSICAGYLIFSNHDGISDKSLSRTPASFGKTQARGNVNNKDLDKAEWSVRSEDFENSVPTSGRSYFDYVFSKKDPNSGNRVYDVPYPFQKMVERVRNYLQVPNSQTPPYQSVLIPVGRSLQRNAALIEMNPSTNSGFNLNLSFENLEPYFFRFPRVVFGVVGDNPGNKNEIHLNLKGRLYLGFHEKSKVVEVISYNDDEGRYEYQVVRNYENGSTPHVVYANRQVCLTCHQNQSPIFSVGPWSEINHNPKIQEKLLQYMTKSFLSEVCDSQKPVPFCTDASGKKYYFGTPILTSTTAPQSLDLSTDLANENHTLQKMWLSLCTTPTCRTDSILAMLKYRLAKNYDFKVDQDVVSVLDKMDQDYNAQFPNGIKVPSMNIPNRDPFSPSVPSNATDMGTKLFGSFGMAVDLEQEPFFQNKPPVEWFGDLLRTPSEKLNYLLRKLASYFTRADLEFLNQSLANKSSLKFEYELKSCFTEMGDETSLSCRSEISNPSQSLIINEATLYKEGEGYSGDVFSARIRLNGINYELRDLSLIQDVQNSNEEILAFNLYESMSLRARMPNGYLIDKLIVNLKNKSISLKVVDDLSYLKLLLGKIKIRGPFQRLNIMSQLNTQLGNSLKTSLIEAIETLPLDSDEDIAVQPLGVSKATPLDPFKKNCAMCHYNFEGVPPAFLGTKQFTLSDFDKCSRVEQCAPRILYRLKVRFCSQLDSNSANLNRKNPMPVKGFFIRNHLNEESWKNTELPVLIERTQKLINKSKLSSISLQKLDALLNETTTMCDHFDQEDYELLPNCGIFQNSSEASDLCKSFLAQPAL